MVLFNWLFGSKETAQPAAPIAPAEPTYSHPHDPQTEALAAFSEVRYTNPEVCPPGYWQAKVTGKVADPISAERAGLTRNSAQPGALPPSHMPTSEEIDFALGDADHLSHESGRESKDGDAAQLKAEKDEERREFKELIVRGGALRDR